MDVKEYESIVQYLKNQQYDNGASENEKRRIRAKKDIFGLKTHNRIDFLYTKQGQAVVTTVKKENVLKMCHIDSGSHLG